MSLSAGLTRPMLCSELVRPLLTPPSCSTVNQIQPSGPTATSLIVSSPDRSASNSVTWPSGAMRPSIPLSASPNHRLPSSSASSPVTLAPDGTACSTMAPVSGSMRAIDSLRPSCVNQTPPSSPPTMSPGTVRSAAGYSVIVPAGVILPTPGRRPCSVNQRLPSGPGAMSAGALSAVRPVENSVTRLAWAVAGATARARDESERGSEATADPARHRILVGRVGVRLDANGRVSEHCYRKGHGWRRRP